MIIMAYQTTTAQYLLCILRNVVQLAAMEVRSYILFEILPCPETVSELVVTWLARVFESFGIVYGTLILHV